jgi:MFS family permease
VDQVRLRQLADQATVRLLNKPGTASSNRGGWMMIATILIEAWDLYAISFLLVFISAEYHPTPAQLGLATAAVQGGALIGAVIGGVVADRLGRKRVFILTMVLFIILAIAQGFSQSIWDLIIIRFLIGIPLGSDIANGYAYIMESMAKGSREKMGSRWQAMFGLGEVAAIVVITLMHLEKPKVGDFLKVMWADPIKKRATIFGWISNACQGAEFTAFGFYLPVILVVAGVGVSGSGDITGTNIITALIYVLATIAGFLAPWMLARTGHRGLSMWGFGMAFVGLVVGAFALQFDWKIVIVIAACVLMWGHYWDASNGMTINSMVAPPRFKATASGFAYVFVKAASFFGAFIFPIMNAAWGKFGATLAVSGLSLIGFLSAKFILPEVYGYVEQEELAVTKAALGEGADA